METKEPTTAEREQLRQALQKALEKLGDRVYAELTADHPDDEQEVLDLSRPEIPLAKLIVCKYADEELDVLAEKFARAAGARGANYAELGAAWGISRQAARKRWPGAVSALSERANKEPVHFQAFGGEARVSFHPEDGGWWWIATAANRQHQEAPEGVTYDTSEEASAAAGAFLAANTTEEPTR
ncbi:hypothetical protein G3I61_11530 [Streptomyces diastaticus]|nr:hypothetical protein [Streptomyces diastaticus]NEB60354.1 hypothetical protein [Streptomyces diastaticus]